MDERLKHLNAMRSFESAARHQSYSQAARELSVSQAAISQQIRHLEQVLSVKLFKRKGRKMCLTENGQRLFLSTHQAMNTLIDGLNGLLYESEQPEVTITSTSAFCSLWLMPRLYKFAQLHPEISIKIISSNQKEDLEKQQIDLAIRFGVDEGVADNDSLTIEDFGEDVIYPVCSPSLLQDVWLHSPKNLLQCCLFSVTESKVTWQDWFEEAGVVDFSSHTNQTEVSSSDMALSAVIGGHGVALASSAIFSQYIHSKQLVVPFKIKHPATWKRYFVYNIDSLKYAQIQTIIGWLREEMATEQPKVLLR